MLLPKFSFAYMTTLVAMTKKEFLLVLRDKHALAALFIMPCVFILIMSLALKDEFGTNRALISYSINSLENNTDNNDINKKSTHTQQYILHLEQNPLLKHVNGNSPELQFQITLPQGFNDTFSPKSKKNLAIKITVSSDVKPDLVAVFKTEIIRELMNLRTQLIKQSLGRSYKKFKPIFNKLNFSSPDLIDIEYKHFKQGKKPSSTQQSVPSWIVFGLFFVVIPMSTIFINERRENTLIRLHAMNVSIPLLFLGKVLPYLIINQIQVWLMIAVGLFVVPFFGAEALTLGQSISGLIVLSLCLSLSAIGLAMLIASLTTTTEQATTIGGILNILLGSIGGIMIPKFIMPESMQSFANISPMSWGLEGYLDIFLREKTLVDILPESFALVLFAIIMISFSALVLSSKLKRGLI